LTNLNVFPGETFHEMGAGAWGKTPARNIAKRRVRERRLDKGLTEKILAGLDSFCELAQHIRVRLWTLHPRYLDSKGLVAAWREGLLAQKVLSGGTRGYRHHPQLVRFRFHRRPLPVIAAFLLEIAREAERRGYDFDTSKISPRRFSGWIEEKQGQLRYEWKHLQAKLRRRAPQLYREHRSVVTPEPHPLFRIVPGDISDWEKV
jgi:hypothetical protein